MASQIEQDGQDYGDKDDGSEDEDQDTILDDPAVKREREREGGGGWLLNKSCTNKQTHKTATSHMCTCPILRFIRLF